MSVDFQEIDPNLPKWKQRIAKFHINHQMKFRTRNSRIKFVWTRLVPVVFIMGVGIEYIKFQRPNYRDRKLGLSVTISDRDAEAYREYLRTHGSQQLKQEQ